MVAAVSQISNRDRRTQLAEVLVGIVADRGLEAVSVREVAGAAGLSIGAVQHHFSTKSEMLTFAFAYAVERTRSRIGRLERTGDRPADISRVLEELLPLDDERRTDATINLAFSSRAAWAPELQAIQADLLAEIRAEISEVLGTPSDGGAALLLALVDGLALHALSAPGTLAPTVMRALLEDAVTAVLDGTAASLPGRQTP